MEKTLKGSKLAAEARVWCLQAIALGAALLVAPRLLASAVDLPKRLLVEGFLIAGWVVLLAEGLEKGRLSIRRSPLDLPLLALLASITVSSLLAINRSFALEHAGLALSYAGIVWLIVSGVGAGKQDRLLSALLLAGGIEGVYGILQYAGIDFLPWASSWGSRCFGTIGNPVFYAEFLAPLFVLSTALWIAERDDERKDLLALLVLVLFLALVFAQTRSAWLGSLAGLGALGVCLARLVPGGRDLIRQNRTWLLAFAGFAVAVVVTISSPAVFGKRALPLPDRVADMFNFKGWTVQHRLVLWRAAALMVRDRPLLGAGPEHFRAYFPLKQATFREGYIKRAFHFPPKEQKAHNDYVQMAAELGIVGLGLMLWLLAVVGRLGLCAVRRSSTPEIGAKAAGLLGGCFALVVDAFFNFPFRTIPAATVFWMLAGGLVWLAGAGFPIDVPLGSVSLGVRRAGAVAVAVAGVWWFGWLAVPQLIADRALSEGNRYFGYNMWEMAVGGYGRSLEFRPYDVYAHYQRAYAQEKSSAFDWTGHGWDRALNHYAVARKLGLNDELLYGQMALLYEKKGHLKRSIEMAERAVRIYPQGWDQVANLAYWYSVREEHLDVALKLAQRALAAIPDHPLYLWTYGLVLEKLGKSREALEALQSALPQLPRIQDGQAYESDLTRDIARLKKLAL